jgi:DNA-binding HxlR family transcriptional regulator
VHQPLRQTNENRRRIQSRDIANACDLLGKRWALHIVRELAHGPQRFTDLYECLPGISANALTARLRELERANVIRRRLLPPPAASAVYELTEEGSEFGEIILALNQWGVKALAATNEVANRRSSRRIRDPGTQHIR